MKKGFHLIDGLLACFIVIVSMQATLVLSQKTGKAEVLIQEKRSCWEILKKLRQCPVEILDQHPTIDFSFQGDLLEQGGFFRVTVEKIDEPNITEYLINLNYTDALGQPVQKTMQRWEPSPEPSPEPGLASTMEFSHE